jgi:hypothetical protein
VSDLYDLLKINVNVKGTRISLLSSAFWQNGRAKYFSCAIDFEHIIVE